MGNIAESLKENLEHILKELPEELHEDAKKAAEGAQEAVRLSADEEVAAIKKELVDNPDIDESVVGEIDPATHQPPAPPTKEEQEAAIAEAQKNPPSESPGEAE